MNCLQCSICSEDYNLNHNKPITLSCGHTFCQQCLQGISNLNNNIIQKCSLCNQDLNIFYTKLSINILLMQIIEKNKLNSKKLYCNKHQKEVQFYQEQFNLFKCKDCNEDNLQDFQIFKSHVFFDELKQFEQILKTSQKKNFDIQNILDNIEKLQSHNLITDQNFIIFKQGLYDDYQKIINNDLQQLNKLQFFNPNKKNENIQTQTDFINEKVKQILLKWLDNEKIEFQLIYKASKDGFESQTFHEKCDMQGKTIIFLKSQNNQIFGGYADQSWNSKGTCIEGKGKSFLFSLTNMVKLKCKDKKKEMNGNSYGYGAVFGFGKDTSDLAIYGDCNQNQKSHSNLGNSYELPQGIQQGYEAKKYLAGSKKFKILEIEVHKIIE